MTLQGLVAQAYPSPEWAVFYEVSNGTGFGARRRADAVALGVWPSRGHAIIGFEFKEDRRDWLKELATPEKADAVAEHCDGWFLVTGREGIAKIDEVPQPWGLLVANADRSKLLTKKPCVPFEGRDKGLMRRSFAAAMLRKVTETTVPRVELDRQIQAAVKDAVDRTAAGAELKNLRAEVERLRNVIETFKGITGLDMNGWHGPKRLANAVHAVLSTDGHRRDLELTHTRLTLAAKDIAVALQAWPRAGTEVE